MLSAAHVSLDTVDSSIASEDLRNSKRAAEEDLLPPPPPTISTQQLPYPTLAPYHLPNAPPTIYYIPNFIPTAHSDSPTHPTRLSYATLPTAAQLLHEINTAPLPKWTKLKNRRLQTYGARVGGEGDKPAVFVDDFPKLIDGVREKLGEMGLWGSKEDKPNNCLVNEYLPGQGILPHEDGPAFHPVIATVSLGGSCILDLYPKGGGDRGKRQPTCRLLLAPNSLLVMTNEAYTSHLHGIDETDVDTVHLAAGNNVANWDETEVGGNPTNGNIVKMPREETRVSVTFRSAKRVVRPSAAVMRLAGGGLGLGKKR